MSRCTIMKRKSLVVGIIIAIIGFLLIVTTAWLLPYYSWQIGALMIVVGVLIIDAERRHPPTQPFNEKGSVISEKSRSKSVSTRLLRYILGISLWNVLVIVLFVQADQNLFYDLTRFGLNGSWNLFTLNLQRNIDNSIQTYSYTNPTIILLLGCVIGNIFLTSVSLYKIAHEADHK
jgi:hypothetical protein